MHSKLRKKTTFGLLKRMVAGERDYYKRKLLKWYYGGALGHSAVARERLEVILDLIRPVPVGNHIIRVGNTEDGGYMCIDNFDTCERVISCGISDDVSFDLCYAQQGIPVFQYDDSVDGPPVEHEQFRFRRNRVEGEDRPEHNVYSLDSILRQDLEGATAAVLKLDIESSEWAALATLAPGRLKQHVSAIYIEFHGLSQLLDDAFYERARCVFASLREDYVPVSLHPNNNGELVVFGNRAFPDIFELSFIRRDLVEPIHEARGSLPEVGPNNSGIPDIHLGDLLS